MITIDRQIELTKMALQAAEDLAYFLKRKIAVMEDSKFRDDPVALESELSNLRADWIRIVNRCEAQRLAMTDEERDFLDNVLPETDFTHEELMRYLDLGDNKEGRED